MKPAIAGAPSNEFRIKESKGALDDRRPDDDR